MQKLKGFTLAEVLITLAIIGVVVAMTIPTLIANYQKTRITTELKLFNTNIEQVIQFLEAENGVGFIIPRFNESDGFSGDANKYSWELSHNRFEEYFAKYFMINEKYDKKYYQSFSCKGLDNSFAYCSSTFAYTNLVRLNNGVILGYTQAGNFDGIYFSIVLWDRKKVVNGKNYFTATYRIDSNTGRYKYFMMKNRTDEELKTACQHNSLLDAAYGQITCYVLLKRHNFEFGDWYPKF